MSDMNYPVIVGIGHKARQGKDTFANLFVERGKDSCVVLHFSDYLYEECKNKSRKFPLIKKGRNENEVACLDYFNRDVVSYSYAEPTPYVKELILKENFYMGMDEKNGSILQFWASNFRRDVCSQDFYLNDVIRKVNKISPDKIILIPDVRNKNEYEWVRRFGIYVEVQRLNPDGSRFIANDRDPNFISEVDLDNVEYDFIVRAVTGDMQPFKIVINEIVKKLNRKI